MMSTIAAATKEARIDEEWLVLEKELKELGIGADELQHIEAASPPEWRIQVAEMRIQYFKHRKGR